jgi:ubiquinone/menaquinone biosynthesis C-methylase UbiE
MSMALFKAIASQLRKPSGLIGRFLIARLLNRGNAPLNLLTLKCLELRTEDRVLEVGFGGGYLLGRIAETVREGFIAGVDFSPEMVRLCGRRLAPLIVRKRMALHCASAERLPLESDSFTKVCTVNTIYFWPDPIGPLKEMHRVLHSGGRLVVCFNPTQTLKKVPYTRHGFSFYDPAAVEKLLADAGFYDIRMVDGSSSLGEFKCAIGIKPPAA